MLYLGHDYTKGYRAIRIKYGVLQAEFDERNCRMRAATEAKILGHGGVAAISRQRD